MSYTLQNSAAYHVTSPEHVNMAQVWVSLCGGKGKLSCSLSSTVFEHLTKRQIGSKSTKCKLLNGKHLHHGWQRQQVCLWYIEIGR